MLSLLLLKPNVLIEQSLPQLNHAWLRTFPSTSWGASDLTAYGAGGGLLGEPSYALPVVHAIKQKFSQVEGPKQQRSLLA